MTPETAPEVWTPEERQRVYETLLEVAKGQLRFTMEDVWGRLSGSVPAWLHEMEGVWNQVVLEGRIIPTLALRESERCGHPHHDYGRLLRVWGYVPFRDDYDALLVDLQQTPKPLGEIE